MSSFTWGSGFFPQSNAGSTVNLYTTVEAVRRRYPVTTRGIPDDLIQNAVVEASGEIESATQRILMQNTYLNEECNLVINRHYEIVGKVRQWPIQSITSLSIRTSGTQTFYPLDITKIDFLRPPERLFFYEASYIPQWTQQGFNGYQTWSRMARGVIQYSYTAGYPPTALPQDLKSAATTLAMYYLMMDANPLGASSLNVGGGSASFGDENLNIKKAYQTLDKYTRRE